jgi:hypothetical protein
MLEEPTALMTPTKMLRTAVELELPSGAKPTSMRKVAA